MEVKTVYCHEEFCDEELQVQAQVRTVLLSHGAKLESYWGGLTVHHIEDLGFDVHDSKQMPMYKGEFQRAAKRRPIREALTHALNLSSASSSRHVSITYIYILHGLL